MLGFFGSLVTPQDNRNEKTRVSSGNTASSTGSHPANQSTVVTKTPTPTPEPKLVLVKAVWQAGGFGTVAIWHVTIKNESSVPLGDIKYRTIYKSETGNIVSKGGVDGLVGKDTIEKIVPSKSTRTFEVNDGFIGDEAHSGGFEIVSWREIPK